MRVSGKLFMTVLISSFSYLISILLFMLLVFTILQYKKIESQSYDLMTRFSHVQLRYNNILLSKQNIQTIAENWQEAVEAFDRAMQDFSKQPLRPFFSDEIRKLRLRITELWQGRIVYFIGNLHMNLYDLDHSARIREIMERGNTSLVQLYMNSEAENITLTANEVHSIERFVQNYYLLEYSGEMLEKNLYSLNQEIKRQSTFLIRIIISLISLLTLFLLLLSFILVTAISRTFTEKVKKIEKTIRKVSRGEFSVGLKFTSHDEFGELSRNFDIFITALQNNLNSLHDFTRNVDQALVSEQDFTTLLDKISASLKKAVNADSVSIYMLDREKQLLTELCRQGRPINPFLLTRELTRELSGRSAVYEAALHHPGESGKLSFTYQGTFFAETISSQNPLFIKRAGLPGPFPDHSPGISSFIQVPVFIAGELYGIISLVKCADAREKLFYDLDYIHSKTFGEYTGLAIDNYHKIRVLKEKTLLQKEMEVARTIQTSLLPPEYVHPELEMSAIMITADLVGGDYYDITRDKSGHLWFAVGDVSGHGVTAGLIMMMAQTSFLSCLYQHKETTPKEAVTAINTILYENINTRMHVPYCMTMTLFKYLGQGAFLHAGAHLDLIIYRKKSAACELLESRGSFLGFIPDISASTMDNTFTLEPGDILLLCTDGVTEARHKENRELLGEKRLARLLSENARLDIELLKKKLIDHILEWSGGRIADDLTLLLIKRKEGL